MAEWRNRIVGSGDENPDQLLANPANWRIHPKAQQDALSGVLTQVGWVQNVIVNQRTGHVVDGHLRVSLALSRQEPTIPVVYVDLSQDEERLILATLDPLAAMAQTDADMLERLTADLEVEDAAVRAAIAAIDGAKHEPKAGLTDPDDVPEVAEPITKPGDLWILGDHRLLCGDATSEADHERLLDGASVSLVLTDPPYGVGVDYESFADTTAEVRDLVARFMPIVRKWPVVLLTPGIPVMWAYPPPKWLLAWVHPAAASGCPWGFASLNPILAYGADPYLARGKGRRDSTLVLAADRRNEDIDHPVAKPVAVWAWLLERGSVDEGDNILDPFSGSGTTIIACEQLGRCCYAIEIEPKYVDVAVKRWEQFTGKTAVRDGR